MAWHDEWPHKVCASVLLLDGKIEGWKTGYPPKKEPGEFRAYWKRDRLNDYTVEHTCFEVNNDQEHNDAFEILAPEWFRQWELAEDLHGSHPYSDKADKARTTRNEILAMKPGPEMDEAVGKVIGATPKIKWFAMNKEENAYWMDSESRIEIEDWHNDQVKRFPDGRYLSSGGHVVRKEIYRLYSTDISAALEVIDKMNSMPDLAFNNYLAEHIGLSLGAWAANLVIRELLQQLTPEVICKAALLTQVEP